MLSIKSNSTVSDPSNELEYLENDFGIIRGLTLGLVDTSHPLTFGGASYEGVQIPDQTAVIDLTAGGASGIVYGNIDNGLSNGAVEFSALDLIRMPVTNLKPVLDGSITKGVAIGWVRLPSSFPNTANGNAVMFGDDGGSSNNYGGLFLGFTASSDEAVMSVCFFKYFGASGTLPSEYYEQLQSGICQLALVMNKVSDTTANTDLYLNGVKIKSHVATPYNVAIQGSSDYFNLGSYGAFDPNVSGYAVGRINIANLTGSDMTAEEYILRDFNHAREFFGV
jgi:hypothetical protein